MVTPTQQDLVWHLGRSTGLPAGTAERAIADVVAYFSDTVEGFVRRRHRELRAEHVANAVIWSQLGEEISRRRFNAPELSERQLRRMVYG